MNDVLVPPKCGFRYFKIQDPENSLQVKPFLVEVENSREEDMKSVMKSVNEVRTDLENLKTEVCDSMEKKNADYLRKKMFGMEEKISNLKEAIKQELLKLLGDEASLSKDVQFLEKRVEEWGKPLYHQVVKPLRQRNYKNGRKDEENPAVELQKFLDSSGGRCGGWAEHDHLLFLKERSKYKKKEKFFSALHCLLPDLSYEAIEEHENWYIKFESLKNSQKEAIQKWKQKKETQQRQEKEKEESKQEKKEVKKTVRQSINIAERIKEWKNQQLLNKLKEEERLKAEKEKLKAEEKRKREMQEMKKLAIAQYKEEKLRKMRESFSSKEKPLQGQGAQEAKLKNKILLNAFRLQDLKFIEKKKIIRLQIESKANEKVERLKLAKPALELILRRDPQRVFQPTLIWNQHCLESQKREKVNPVFDLNSIPRLDSRMEERTEMRSRRSLKLPKSQLLPVNEGSELDRPTVLLQEKMYSKGRVDVLKYSEIPIVRQPIVSPKGANSLISSFSVLFCSVGISVGLVSRFHLTMLTLLFNFSLIMIMRVLKYPVSTNFRKPEFELSDSDQLKFC